MDQPADPRADHADPQSQVEAAEFVRRLFEATPRTWVTTALVAVNLGVFLFMVASGVSPMEPTTEDLLRFGADFGPLTVSGQWWRLLSSTFVHVGLLHVGFNLWALWQCGRLVERFFGNGAFLFLYLASGIGASVASILWHPAGHSAGASGAIFGMFGGLLAVLVTNRGEIPPTLFHGLSRSTITVVAINVFLGLSVPVIDNAAHLGGLATGFALGLCLRRSLPAPSVRVPGAFGSEGRRYIRALPVLALVATGAAAAKLRVDASPSVQAMRHFDLALEAYDAKDADRAMKEVEAALALEPDDARTLSVSGYLRWLKGDHDGAESDYIKAARIAPDYPEPRRRLAWLRQDAGDLEGASRYFDDAIRLDRTDADSRARRGSIRLRQGKIEEALLDFDAALKIDATCELARTLRPFALYDLRRWPDALAAFRESIGKHSSKDRLPELYVWAIRARTGEAEAADRELKTAFASPAEDAVRSRIATFLLGGIAEAEFMAQAEKRGRTSSNGQPFEMCETRYFVGMKHLVAGRTDLALQAFRKCVETNAIDTPAWSSAVAEIAASKQ